MYYDCKIEYQEVQGGSMTDNCSMLYSIVEKGIHPAGFSIWTGLQVLIKKTPTFLSVNLIHISSPPDISDFPPLEWIRRTLVYLDSTGKEFNIYLSQGNSCSTDRGKALEITGLGSSPDFMVNSQSNNGQLLFRFPPLCFPSPILHRLLESLRRDCPLLCTFICFFSHA